MVLVILLALAYGTPGWSFPWWVWLLAAMTSSQPVVNVVLKKDWRREA